MRFMVTCLVVFLLVCILGGSQAGKKKGHKRRGGRAPHHMCVGVLRRAGLNPRGLDCTSYDEDVNEDLRKLYNGEHRDVFKSWISAINTITRRELEADADETGDDDHPPTEAESGVDDLLDLCKRKVCFMKKLKEHIRKTGNDVPEFCQAKTPDQWATLRQQDRPQPGQPREPMDVDRYVTIFCTKARTLPRADGSGKGAGGRGRGRKSGKQGGRRGGRRRQQGVDGDVETEEQDVPVESAAA